MVLKGSVKKAAAVKPKAGASARGRARAKARAGAAVAKSRSGERRSQGVPAWETALWSAFPVPRARYLEGVWDYARGRAAVEHPRYGEAVALAEESGWNPWWIRTWQDVAAVLRGHWFDEDAAWRICEYYRRFVRLSKGQTAGQPIVLIEWQVYDLLAPLFGWKRADGLRRFRRGGLWIPKKNGKSSIMSPLPLYSMKDKRDGGAEVYCVAGDVKQGSIIFNETVKCLKQMPEAIRLRYRVRDSIKTIYFDENNAMFAVLSSDVGTKEGINASVVQFDELHVQPNREMWDTLEGSSMARQEPLQIYLSTAGSYDPQSIGWEQWTIAEQVRAGEREDATYFSLCYQADPAADIRTTWKDYAQWERANPSIGCTFDASEFEAMVRGAEGVTGKVNRFLRYHLNVWVHASERWLPQGVWDRCRGAYGLEDFVGKRCFLGIDLGSTNDTTALVVFCGGGEGRKHRMWSWFFLPEDNIAELELQHGVPYREWAESGLITLTPGNATDYRFLRAQVAALKEMGVIIEQARFDPYNATSLVTDLMEDGVTCVAQGQSLGGLAPAVREVDLWIRRRELEQPGHPVMTWQVGNCRVYFDANENMKLMKAEGGKNKRRHKIDGPYALLNAVRGYQDWLATNDGWTGEEYKTEGLTVIRV